MGQVKKINFQILQICMLFLIIACGVFNSGETFTSEQETSDSESDKQKIIIPSSPQVAPSDIFDQVVFEGTGGGDGSKWCPCVYVEGSTLILEGFPPNKQLRLVAYDEYTFGYGNYYADWSVTVDSSGYLEISLGGYINNITFFAFDLISGQRLGPVNRVIIPIE